MGQVDPDAILLASKSRFDGEADGSATGNGPKAAGR